MKRLWACGLAAATMTLSAAGAASACTLMPPLRWDLVPQQDGMPIVIGRVVSVVPDGGDVWNDFVRADIETLEVLQGDVPSRFSVRGISERRADPHSITMWCGRLMSDQPGDIVMAVSRSEGRYELLLPMQVAEHYRQRMENYAADIEVKP